VALVSFPPYKLDGHHVSITDGMKLEI